jgi:hypothetical protein
MATTRKALAVAVERPRARSRARALPTRVRNCAVGLPASISRTARGPVPASTPTPSTPSSRTVRRPRPRGASRGRRGQAASSATGATCGCATPLQPCGRTGDRDVHERALDPAPTLRRADGYQGVCGYGPRQPEAQPQLATSRNSSVGRREWDETQERKHAARCRVSGRCRAGSAPRRRASRARRSGRSQEGRGHARREPTRCWPDDLRAATNLRRRRPA